jgi:hypothetical protein
MGACSRASEPIADFFVCIPEYPTARDSREGETARRRKRYPEWRVGEPARHFSG